MDIASQAQHAHPLTHPDGSPVRILVVDDEPDLAEVLSGVLRYEGWEVRTAGDVASALRRPEEHLESILLRGYDQLQY